jgi:hypothetical protein
MDINNFIKSKAEQMINTNKDINIIIIIIIPQEHLKEADNKIKEKL